MEKMEHTVRSWSSTLSVSVQFIIIKWTGILGETVSLISDRLVVNNDKMLYVNLIY